jgi:membrane-bound lytic murein transglycosylase A
MKKYWITFVSSLLFTIGTIFYFRSLKESDPIENIALDSLINDYDTNQHRSIEPTEKVLVSAKKSSKLWKILTKVNIDALKLPSIQDKFRQALEYQEAFIKSADSRDIGGLEVAPKHLTQVLNAFRKAKSKNDIANYLDAYQLRGDDNDGNVLFTGYYSPVIPARRKADAVFKYPVFLAQNKRADDGMTLAYVRDRQDIRSMQLEGVAYLQFPDGERRVVAYDGDSRQIENDSDERDSEGKKVLTSYTSVFTQRDKNRAMGAAKVPLTTDFTVAVDAQYLPLGSVLLAEVPILDNNGNLMRTEMRFVLAQDRGSKIKGTGHIDLYMGEGDAAKERIKDMHRFGKIWLLLPKRDEKEAPSKALAQKL